MNTNLPCITETAASLCISENRSSYKSKESIKKPMKLNELFHRDLNTSIMKLCSEADLRIKVLLSNTGSRVVSSLSKSSSKDPSSTLTTSITSSSKLSSCSTTQKTISLGSTKPNSRSSKHYKKNTSFSSHLNTEIDNIDNPTNKQLTVYKVLKLIDLARRMEKRQKNLIKNKFESSAFEKSYIDGLEEGLRYGYFNTPKEELKPQTKQTEWTDSSSRNLEDQILMKNNEVVLAENKESNRMRGGFQDPQQQEIYLKNTFDDHNISSPSDRKEYKSQAKSFNELNQSGIAITNEYPTNCDENVDVEAFNQKYRASTPKSKPAHEANVPALIADKEYKYLNHFEKMLSSLGEEYAKGFRKGFEDGFKAANIYAPNDTAFSEDEQEYIKQMRKWLKFSDVDINNDVKKIMARAHEIKNNLNIPIEEFEEISSLLQRKIVKTIPLKFSKNDYKHYSDASKRDRGNTKITFSNEDECSMTITSYEDVKEIPQETNNRARRYLANHKINEFFQYLGSHLVATKPDDPITFLINLLDKCIEYRIHEYALPAPLLFTKKHVESVYFVLDPLSTGFIDLSQYVHGMEALGLKDMDDINNFRSGEKIDKHLFITNAYQRLLWNFRAMIAIDHVTVRPSNADDVK